MQAVRRWAGLVGAYPQARLLLQQCSAEAAAVQLAACHRRRTSILRPLHKSRLSLPFPCDSRPVRLRIQSEVSEGTRSTGERKWAGAAPELAATASRCGSVGWHAAAYTLGTFLCPGGMRCSMAISWVTWPVAGCRPHSAARSCARRREKPGGPGAAAPHPERRRVAFSRQRLPGHGGGVGRRGGPDLAGQQQAGLLAKGGAAVAAEHEGVHVALGQRAHRGEELPAVRVPEHHLLVLPCRPPHPPLTTFRDLAPPPAVPPHTGA